MNTKPPERRESFDTKTIGHAREVLGQDGERCLEGIAGSIRREGIEVETMVTRGDPAVAIAEAARTMGTGLVDSLAG